MGGGRSFQAADPYHGRPSLRAPTGRSPLSEPTLRST
jgi:hypothetical protein